jgi:hypothetical protein
MASLTTRLKPGKKRAPQLLADSTLMRCALDRLGQSMLSPATAPRVEFRQSLRAELVALAAVQASAVRPLRRPPKVRKPKGGFRLAALGLGITAAGGGFALAANRVSTPEVPQLPVTHSTARVVHPSSRAASSTVHVRPVVPARTPFPTPRVASRDSSAAAKVAPSPATRVSNPPRPTAYAPAPSTAISSAAMTVAGGISSGAAGTSLPTAPAGFVPHANPFKPRAGVHWTWPSPFPGQLP